ncbi:MAG TPA: TonB family protein [Steroidobacteraceae bacterium]|nr:TonB family protein [Steroidobacteraceae bacterium]
MSATTVNTFPPLHALNSPRSWFLALIVLLHAGFFWALTHGVRLNDLTLPPPPLITQILPAVPKTPPPQQVDVRPDIDRVFVPPIETPDLPPVDLPNAPHDPTSDPQPVPPQGAAEAPGAGPLIVEPQLDSRYPFTEPDYPVSEIRLGHEGTVLLALQILPNGRVGAVRIEQSSGYVKLDESAALEARRWRMKPGTSDGTAMPMWKRVPIKFQLKN